ncbi:unnamed protein product [Linum tenue]|uniref:Uncharacterized protein n=1 Tax=Linum tenue TaxID=586396 RepID=A0AAV0QDK0_9ROSI|nr:unnamed protein product [Linum tenue]
MLALWINQKLEYLYYNFWRGQLIGSSNSRKHICAFEVGPAVSLILLHLTSHSSYLNEVETIGATY